MIRRSGGRVFRSLRECVMRMFIPESIWSSTEIRDGWSTTSRSQPGSDPAQAELEFNGAKQLALKDGALVIQGENGSLQLEAPRVYQEIAGQQQPVEGSFVLRGKTGPGSRSDHTTARANWSSIQS